MEAWVGPAIVAAIISGLVSMVVVQLNFRQERRSEQLRRNEKIRDFQIALRAEIRAELRNLSNYDIEAQRLSIKARYDADPNYSVSVVRPARQAVFEALIHEIHVLPESVIDAVVLYERQRNAVESLAEDMRSASFRSLSRGQQLAMYEDYLQMWNAWRDFASAAEATLDGRALVSGPRSGLPSDGLNDGQGAGLR